MRRVTGWLRDNAQGVAATLAFGAVAAGFWLLSPALGLIVPGGIVFGALAYSHLRGGS